MNATLKIFPLVCYFLNKKLVLVLLKGISLVCLFLFIYLGVFVYSCELFYRDRTRAEQFLVRWAIPQLHDIDALGKMVDPSLNRQYPAKSLSHFADIISRCVQVKSTY